MKIAKNTVVTVDYKLSDAQGDLIEEGREPMVCLLYTSPSPRD